MDSQTAARLTAPKLPVDEGPPLRIGLVSPPWVAVPPPGYGGTEFVVDNLARGLAAAGHDVVLFATGDSSCPVPLRWAFPEALGTTEGLLPEMEQVQAAYDSLHDVDLIHDHTVLGPVWALASGVNIPLATTAHGAFVPALARMYRMVGDRVAVVAISEHHRSTIPDVAVARVIHHGVEPQSFPFGDGSGGYALFLGRMSPDKAPQLAIAAARAAGLPIRLAAKMWHPDERSFFAEQVEPLLGPDAVYVGEVGGQAKLELLAGAVALVNPIQWPEPFGLAMIEALACGTPVVTYPQGAASEIVEPGVTGFLATDEADFAAKLALVDGISRAACRDAVATRFSVERMVAEHVALYRELIAGRS